MKDKTTAAILAIFLGGIGIHKFYLGETGAGIIYLIFACTGIPYFIAFIEFIIYLTMSDAQFNAKYNRHQSGRPMMSQPVPALESSREKAATLGEMKKLYDAGVITAEEYEEKRRKILDSI
ncbi:MAG: NINE protein [Cyanobacteria bacterium J06643_4]